MSVSIASLFSLCYLVFFSYVTGVAVAKWLK